VIGALTIQCPHEAPIWGCLATPANSTMHSMSETTFFEAVKSGETISFESLYRAHAEKLVRTALRITRNHEDAEDAAQDSFLRAFKHFETFDGRSTFSTWLTRIGINSALMILRKKRALREAAVPTSKLAELMETVPNVSPDPEQLYESLERKRNLERAITKLSQKKKVTLELHFLEERSLPEAAHKLGISLGAAKARVFQAKTAIRKSRVLRQIKERSSEGQAYGFAQNAGRQKQPGRCPVFARFGPTQSKRRICSYQ
jgi:RNA polymerase sigma-70 factor (ECF subfamily)